MPNPDPGTGHNLIGKPADRQTCTGGEKDCLPTTRFSNTFAQDGGFLDGARKPSLDPDNWEDISTGEPSPVSITESDIKKKRYQYEGFTGTNDIDGTWNSRSKPEKPPNPEP